ncbi:CHASE2 domain-containing protein, partial [Zemynaea arenosa]|uniref:CHASE2 domain-containing protein n=1 Tax=Zemynaea arenosa TaxID=2561931 RepID=UPI0014303C4E
MLRRFQQHLRATQGRPLASVLALALAAWLALPGDGPLPWLRLNLFDLYQTALPRPRLSGPVAVIGIDEAALKRYGQWPWPRTQLAHLIDAVNAHHPLAIGLDIIMPETDSSSPEALAARLRGTDAKLAESLAALPPNDDVLAASIRRAPVVLGVAGFDVPAASTTDVVRAWPVRSLGGEARQFVRHYPQALASLPQMQANARGQAILSADLETGLVRRVPLVASVGESLLPSLSLELLRVATGERAVGVHVGEGGIDSVSVGDLTVPTQPGGRVWPHFSKSWPERYVSAAEVLDGRVAPDRLENRIAIVALTGIGLNDYKTTARGQVVPGVDVHAELIESFFDGRFVQRPPSIRWAEVGLFALLAALTIWLLPRFSLRAAAAAGLVLSAGLFGGGAALFWYAGLLFDAASVWVALGFVGVTLLASLLSAAKRDRRESERALQRARESAARTAGELSA